MLDEQGQNECEGLLTEVESLKSMESNRSPGSGGLPAEFYKVFRNDVYHYLVNALSWAYAKEKKTDLFFYTSWLKAGVKEVRDLTIRHS